MNSVFDSPLQVLLVMALVLAGGYVAIKLLRGLFWLLGRVFRGIGWFFGHLFEFVAGMLRDALKLVGCLLAALAYAPALGVSVLFVRRSAALHYLRALRAEGFAAVGCLYRLAIGHVLRLLCLDALTEGLEQRVPEVIARAPGPDRPGSGPGTYPGYAVSGSLQGGGSGARLWLAEPDADKRRQLERAARPGTVVPARVVIKSFSLEEGSTLPQIVRENRALAAARDLGLVLEHELTATRFHYVMPYVPGDDLTAETARLHAASAADTRRGAGGLDDRSLAQALALTEDLLAELERFHRGGLWHKDVKPSNIIVSDGRAHLVDFGLITPLRSAMTLTTHGTEYFRDPEMVRLALRGVKVHEVDGIKFDVYGAGAVLYSLLENSFPAHGSLSRLTRRCPEALRWIVRRAMADLGHRYASATEMLADLRAVRGAADPFGVRPADLPSLRRRPAVAEALAQTAAEESSDAPALPAAAWAPAAPAAAAPGAAAASPQAGTAAVPGGAETRASAPPAGAPRDVPAAGARLRPLTAPYGERRISRKALAAVLLLGLFVGNLFLGSDAGEQRSARLRDVAADELPVVSSIEAASGGDARRSASGAPRQAAALPAVHRESTPESPFQMLEPVSLDRLPPVPQDSLSPPLPLPPVGTVLVLDDLPANADPARVAAVETLCARLRTARFALVGVPEGGAALPADAEVELLAGARSAAGLSDPADAEAVARLSDFLAAQGGTLDALLWIGRAENSSPVQTRVITRSAAVARSISHVLGARTE